MTVHENTSTRMGLARIEEIVPALATAAEAAGTEGFYEALLQVYRRLAPHNIVTVVRYNRFSKPNFLFHRDYSDELAAAYVDRFYELDPFYKYWLDNERPGIVALNEFPATELKRSRYIWEFLQASRIRDELGMLLPPVARSSVAMFLERADGIFRPSEVARIRRFYPLFAGLHHAHVNCTFASLGSTDVGLDPHVNLPMAVVDVSGDMVFANQAWRILEAEDPEIRRARSELEASEHQELHISGQRILHRETLGLEFCLAPGGCLYRIEPMEGDGVLDAPRELFARMCPQLAPRELDIIERILAGLSTNEIAESLHLTRGTIKNYRRRLYAKLDISSERELFLAYINGLSVGASETAAGTLRLSHPT